MTAASTRSRPRPAEPLDPVEHLFDPFAATLADAIADVTRGASIDCRLARRAGLAEVSVDRNVRRNRSIPEVVHELRDVIGLVRTEGDPLASAIPPIDQGQRSSGRHRPRKEILTCRRRETASITSFRRIQSPLVDAFGFPSAHAAKQALCGGAIGTDAFFQLAG